MTRLLIGRLTEADGGEVREVSLANKVVVVACFPHCRDAGGDDEVQRCMTGGDFAGDAGFEDGGELERRPSLDGGLVFGVSDALFSQGFKSPPR